MFDIFFHASIHKNHRFVYTPLDSFVTGNLSLDRPIDTLLIGNLTFGKYEVAVL